MNPTIFNFGRPYFQFHPFLSITMIGMGGIVFFGILQISYEFTGVIFWQNSLYLVAQLVERLTLDLVDPVQMGSQVELKRA